LSADRQTKQRPRNAISALVERTGIDPAAVDDVYFGCVDAIGTDEYLITVAWQGMSPIAAPPDSVPCGAGDYDGADDSTCVNDLCRRVVTTVVRISDLTPT